MSSQPEDIFTWRTREFKRWLREGDPDESDDSDDSKRAIRETAPGNTGSNTRQGSIQPNPHRVYRQLNGTQR